jgi:4-hydroxy-tetrahydrodipicolinate reductase
LTPPSTLVTKDPIVSQQPRFQTAETEHQQKAMTAIIPIKIGVSGALGRMGAAVCAFAEQKGDVEISALFDRPDLVGRTAHGHALVSMVDAIQACDVIVDFSTPEASLALAEACVARAHAALSVPALVIASTGFSQAQGAAIDAAAVHVPIVRSGNFSLGVNLLIGLVRRTAKALGPEDWDIEVFEAHHRRKVDAPSGTALMLGEAAAEARGVVLEEVSERARDGLTGPRTPGAIGFSVARGGGLVGEHSVSFVAEDEIITLSHSARNRALFARGALAAAMWVRGRPAGLYDMMDVLGMGEGG